MSLRRYSPALMSTPPTGGTPAGPTAPTFVGAFSQNASSTTTATATLPTVQTGDIGIVIGIINNTTDTATLGGGAWTVIDDDIAVSSGRYYFAWRTMSVSDTDVSLVSSGAGGKLCIAGAVYRGGTYASRTVWTPGASVTQFDAPDATAAAQDMCVRLYAEKSSTNVSWSTPTGNTSRVTSFGAGGGGVSAGVFDKVASSAGAVGVASSTKSAASAVGCAITVLINGA